MSLLIHHVGHLVTMDPDRRILRDGWLFSRDGWIAALGEGEPPAEIRHAATSTLDARGGIATPGLINTHHHMFQNLARAFSPVANLPLLPWLKGHLPLWRTFTPEDLGLATRVALAELMLTGCTTTSDHHYVFPDGGGNGYIDAQFEAAAALGVRFHGARGSMDTATPLVPDWAVQSTGTVMADSQRLLDLYHDPSPGSMARLVLAPCTVFSCSGDLVEESQRLAASAGLHLHSHCSETREEDDACRKLFGIRQLERFTELGWEGDNVWYAHGIHFTDDEIKTLGARRQGVAHCPCSNMRLGSGICRVQDLRRAGVPVGLGVDGSASNDSGHLLGEARQALLLGRVTYGAGNMTVDDALTIATLGGAACLGREKEIGSLEPGKCADVAVFPMEDLFSSGGENPVDALLLCFPRQVDSLVVHGKVRVREGQIIDLELDTLRAQHRAAATRLHRQER